MISKFFLHNNYLELNNSLLKKHWTETLEHVIEEYSKADKLSLTEAEVGKKLSVEIWVELGLFVAVGNLTGNT